MAGTHGPALALTIGSTAALALPDRPGRVFLGIWNTGANAMLVGLGAAPVGSNGIPIASGASWQPNPAPRDAIFLVSASGTTAVLVDGKNS